MTKYEGKIEAKEQKVTKANQQYFKFTVDGKFWNCFDAIVNQEFNIGDFVEFETIQKGDYENLIPETMKKINAPELGKSNPQAAIIPTYSGESIHKNINENPDSLEIGTPSKGGAIKIYGDFSKPEEFKIKMQNAKKVRDEAVNLFAWEP